MHTFIGDLFRPVGTYLYGRRMYETMVFWETAHTEPDAPPHIVLPTACASISSWSRSVPSTAD